MLMPITFITANTEIPYHTPSSGIMSPRNFHARSRPHEVKCTHMHIGIPLCDSVYVKKKMTPSLIPLGVEYFDLETGLYFARNIQLFLTNSDCIVPIEICQT